MSAGLLDNAALGTEMFAKHFTDLLKTEARKDFVLGDDPGSDGSNDAAVFTGNKADYTVDVITFNSPGEGTVTAYKVTDNRTPGQTDADGNVIPTDGTDLLVGVDVLRFLDGDIHLPLVAPTLDLHAYNITTGNYADNFNTASWSNGAPTWAGAWSESGDPGANPITNGQIQIDAGGGGGTNQLRILDNGDGASIQRTVNLSGAAGATLSFSVSENSFDNGETVVASFSFDNGVSWHQLATFNASTGNDSFSDSLVNYLGNGETFGSTGILKFEAFTSATNGGQSSNNGYIAIDNVNVALTYQTPVNDGTNDYSAGFTEGGPSVHIASGPGITDDGTTIYSAKVVLTNAKPGDSLNRNDIGGDGITGTTDTSVAGQITVNLTGAASFAAYQAAIQAISFSNNSQSPDSADRIIHVTVKDDLINSNVATTTIHVTPTNDSPNAGDENVISNVASGTPYTVPGWALVANDSDPDGPNALSISNVTEGSFNFTAVLNAGNVVITDSSSGSRSFTYTVSDGATPMPGTDTNTVSVSRDTSGNVEGNNSNTPDILIGDGNASTFDAGTGDDIVLAGAGDDTVLWNANNSGSTDGHDFVDGGTNTATGDRFVVTGRTGSETYTIYSNNDHWDGNPSSVSSAVHAGFTGLHANTEIVVARNGSMIAELDNIEEITINGFDSTANNGNNPNAPDGGTPGGDTVVVVGNFNGTSLNFSTITVNGGDDDDAIDISGLTSDHRIVFHGGGGTNHVIGSLRPQDVVDTGPSSTPTGGESGPSGPPGQADQPGDMAILPPVLSGTPADDVLTGSPGDDVASGNGGADVILGNDGADTLKGGDGDDLIKGGTGNDIAFGNAGNDDVFGGAGQDMLFGDEGNDRLFGDDGNDIMEGGAGNDTVYAGSGDDRVLATVNDGDDVYWGEDGSDTVDYSAYTADVKVDLGNGLLQHGSVASTQGGNDAVFGFENFIGGSGNDTIVASSAVNVMDGGSGNDTYVFKSAADANGDVINSFQPGDKIDLSAIDANAGSSGNQSFVLFAGTGFTAAGQLIVTHELQGGVEHTIVAGNTNGDTVADFKIDVVGNHALAASDFHGVN